MEIAEPAGANPRGRRAVGPCQAGRVPEQSPPLSRLLRSRGLRPARGEIMAGYRRLLTSAAILAAVAPNVALAAIRVNVHWKRVEYEVSPRQEMHVSQGGKTFILAPGGVVSNDHNLEASSSFEHPALMENKRGVQYLTKYSIRDGRVIAVNRFAGSIETIVVSTDGHTSCSATVTYSKIPGQRYFVARRVSNDEEMLISTRYSQDVTCQISSY